MDIIVGKGTEVEGWIDDVYMPNARAEQQHAMSVFGPH